MLLSLVHFQTDDGFRKFHKIKYDRFCHYLTPVILIEHLLSISQTQYNKFYMKISVSECTFSDSSLNSPALSFKSIRYSSIWIIRNWANVLNWANNCTAKLGFFYRGEESFHAVRTVNGNIWQFVMSSETRCRNSIATDCCHRISVCEE